MRISDFCPRRAGLPRGTARLAMMVATYGFGLVVGGSSGCGITAGHKAERRPDGTVKLTCQTTLPRCLDRAEEICKGHRYVVIRAVDHHDYLGGQNSANEAQVRTSEALFRCGQRGKSWYGPDADPMAVADPAAAGDGKQARTGAMAPTSARACVPGVTQACIGRGGCRGGQFCLADGAGFAACDCGQSESGEARGTSQAPSSSAPAAAPAAVPFGTAVPGASAVPTPVPSTISPPPPPAIPPRP